MTLEEIKDAIEAGKTVHWSNDTYVIDKQVFASGNIRYDILCTANGHRIGLTWMDGITMNGKEDDFYIK